MLADDMNQMNPAPIVMKEAARILERSAGEAVKLAGKAAMLPFRLAWKLARSGVKAYQNRSLKARISYKRMRKYAEKTHSTMMAAECKFTKEQMQEFSKLAKRYKIPFTAMKKKTPNQDGSYDYQLIYRDRDIEILKMIQAEMLRNKLERDKAKEAILEDPESFNDVVNEKILEDIDAGGEYPEPPLSFEDVLEQFGSQQEERAPENPIIICGRMQPDAHIEMTSKKAEHEGREYLETDFDLIVGGASVKCDEFSHGKFSHFSRMDGGASSEAGEEHWKNMKKELKEKGGFSDDLLIFTDREKYQNYKAYMQERAAAAEIRNNSGESFAARKARLSEELGRLDKGDHTDAALQKIIQKEIRANQNMSRLHRQIKDKDEAALQETDPEKKEKLKEESKALSERYAEAEKELHSLERLEDRLSGVKFLNGVKKEELKQEKAQADRGARNQPGNKRSRKQWFSKVEGRKAAAGGKAQDLHPGMPSKKNDAKGR